MQEVHPLDAQRLDLLWTTELRAAGQEVFEILEPELERIIREVYAVLLNMPPEQTTQDQIDRGFVKFRNILIGRFSEEYLATQRKTAGLLIEKNVDFITYLAIYAIYHREAAICLARRSVEVGTVKEAWFRCLHVALQCDATVSMDSFFMEMERRNKETREALQKRNSSEILRVATFINEISQKTNMLAINASIEAARAGETGKGFAVIASEVRAMAQKTGEATVEISSLTQMQ